MACSTTRGVVCLTGGGPEQRQRLLSTYAERESLRNSPVVEEVQKLISQIKVEALVPKLSLCFYVELETSLLLLCLVSLCQMSDIRTLNGDGATTVFVPVMETNNMSSVSEPLHPECVPSFITHPLYQCVCDVCVGGRVEGARSSRRRGPLPRCCLRDLDLK